MGLGAGGGGVRRGLLAAGPALGGITEGKAGRASPVDVGLTPYIGVDPPSTGPRAGACRIDNRHAPQFHDPVASALAWERTAAFLARELPARGG